MDCYDDDDENTPQIQRGVSSLCFASHREHPIEIQRKIATRGFFVGVVSGWLLELGVAGSSMIACVK